MASVSGAHHVSSQADLHGQIAAASSHFFSGSAASAHETVAGAAHGSAGFDTVTGPGHDPVKFAGQSHGAVEKVVATQTAHQGGVTVQFADGSSLIVAGATKVEGSFFHH